MRETRPFEDALGDPSKGRVLLWRQGGCGGGQQRHFRRSRTVDRWPSREEKNRRDDQLAGKPRTSSEFLPEGARLVNSAPIEQTGVAESFNPAVRGMEWRTSSHRCLGLSGDHSRSAFARRCRPMRRSRWPGTRNALIWFLRSESRNMRCHSEQASATAARHADCRRTGRTNDHGCGCDESPAQLAEHECECCCHCGRHLPSEG